MTRTIATPAVTLLTTLLVAGTSNARPPKDDVPTGADLAKITNDKVQFIDRLLTVVEKEIVPLTQQGVRKGNKLFGGAVLKKSDFSTVVAVTNSETGNPLMHGEITAIHAFYEVPRDKRPPRPKTASSFARTSPVRCACQESPGADGTTSSIYSATKMFYLAK